MRLFGLTLLLFAACSSGSESPKPSSPESPHSTSEGGVTTPTEGGQGTSPEPDSLSVEDSGLSDGGTQPSMDGSMNGGTDSGTQDFGQEPTDGGMNTDKDSSTEDKDSTTPECAEGETRCVNLTVETCSRGKWDSDTECPFLCTDGECSGVCVPGDRDCSGITPRHCNSSGLWIPELDCSYVCGGEGVCSGSCVPGATRCNGNGSETCDATGQWTLTQTCPFVCSGAGTCTGSCAPGGTDCQGDVPRTCNASGTWVSGSACPYVCSAGSCTGVCAPGDRDCQGDVPRQCNASGQWISESACPYVCGGEGVCSGSCDPGSEQCSGLNEQTCNASGQWATVQTCPYVCSAGNCTGVCTPGAQRCFGLASQTCSAQGQWVTSQTCPYLCTGNGTCSGSCSPGATDCQGDVPRSCNASGQWVSGSACQFVCSAGSCTGVCEPGSTQCSGQQIQTCNGSGQWGVASNCGDVAGATSYCAEGSCTFDCNLDYDDCDGNANNGCEANLNTDGANCGSCGHDCCGGTCGSGTCQAFDTGIVANGFDADEDFLYWTNGDSVYKRPKLGGDTITVASGYPGAADVRPHDGTLYWTNTELTSLTPPPGSGWPEFSQGTVSSMPLEGGSITYLGATYNKFTKLYFGNTDLLGALGYSNVSDNMTTAIWKRAYSSAIATWGGTVASSQSEYIRSDAITTDGSYVYYINYSGSSSTIYRASIELPPPLGAGEVFVSPLPSSTYYYYALSADSTNLYYFVDSWGGQSANRGIWKALLATGETTQLVPMPITETVYYNGMVMDGSYLYFMRKVIVPTNITTWYASRVSINGGAIENLSQVIPGRNPRREVSVRLADECFYWEMYPTAGAVATVWSIATNP